MNSPGRVPLLIELRGRNPSETDPLAFIATWSSRYGLQAEQVLNLIKSGEAIIIFEGFDELRNSGRAYDRHQHFNALWRFAYPNTKVVFTGRPNFFLDNHETNRTLRSSAVRGAAGEAFTEIWTLKKLNKEQIDTACRSYFPHVQTGIIESIDSNADFLEIVSRPSMLPVVATIWDEIEALRDLGSDLTGALLIERYLQAIYLRKEAELERDRIRYDAPSGSRYLVLPKPVRELLTICVAWRIAGFHGQNTISRNEISSMVRELYQPLFTLGKSAGVSPKIMEGLIQFEKQFSDDTFADRVEVITSEICSAGLMVPDPAGGIANLRFPHKQFYEYLICKGFCISSYFRKTALSELISKSSTEKSMISRLEREPNSIRYLAECAGYEFDIISTRANRLFLVVKFSILIVIELLLKHLPRNYGEKKRDTSNETQQVEEIIIEMEEKIFRQMIGSNIIKNNNFLLSIIAIGFAGVGISFIMTDIFFRESDIAKMFSVLLLILVTILVPNFIMYISIAVGGLPHVFVKFVVTHWVKAGLIPEDGHYVRSLMIKSAQKGRVQFPVGAPVDKANIGDHLSPAEHFGLHVRSH